MNTYEQLNKAYELIGEAYRLLQYQDGEEGAVTQARILVGSSSRYLGDIAWAYRIGHPEEVPHIPQDTP